MGFIQPITTFRPQFRKSVKIKYFFLFKVIFFYTASSLQSLLIGYDKFIKFFTGVFKICTRHSISDFIWVSFSRLWLFDHSSFTTLKTRSAAETGSLSHPDSSFAALWATRLCGEKIREILTSFLEPGDFKNELSFSGRIPEFRESWQP